MRKAGSVGAGTWPGKVWKGTRMAGRMGGDSITVDNLKIIKVDLDNNLLFVKGAIPGHSKSIVYIEK
jgi:large subunit ribosomal protein L3